MHSSAPIMRPPLLPCISRPPVCNSKWLPRTKRCDISHVYTLILCKVPLFSGGQAETFTQSLYMISNVIFKFELKNSFKGTESNMWREMPDGDIIKDSLCSYCCHKKKKKMLPRPSKIHVPIFSSMIITFICKQF